MKIRTRLILLLIFLAFVFLGFFIFQKFYERKQIIQLRNSVRAEQEYIFDKIMELQGRSLKNFVYDYTFWDDMVDFAAHQDKEWAKVNIDVSLGTFGADAAWVYNIDRKLVYAINDPELDAVYKDVSISKEMLDSLFANSPFCHFFIDTSSGLLEIWGATIHTTEDQDRNTPAQGCFLVSRLWNNELVAEIAQLNNSKVVLSDTVTPEQLSPGVDKIAFFRALSGWDNRPLKYLIVSSGSGALTGAMKTTIQVTLLFVSFSIVITIMVSFFIYHWINTPLRLIALSLKEKNPDFLAGIKKQNTEFGDLSRMVDAFFTQRKTLLEEVSMRKQTQEALNKVNNCFISFGLDPLKNIQLITETAGQILDAACTLYNYAAEGRLETQASWHEPPDFSRSGPGEGHICSDVIKSRRNQLVIIDDLQNTSYAQTDPNVKKYNLQYYVGCPVQVQGKTIATLCAVFTNPVQMDIYHLNLLQVLGKAASIEEERKHMENVFKNQALKLDEALKEALKSREVLLSMLEDNQLNKIKLEASVNELAAAYSKLKTSQEEVLQAAKFGAIGQLASSVAHEVRNPLAIIMQSIEYLGTKVSPQHQEVVQVAANNVRRANTIVATLLDFSKVKEVVMEPADINSIINDSLKLTQYSNLKEKVKVAKELSSDLPKTLADRQKIEQVFVNLFLNAMQAMPAGGDLLIRTYPVEVNNLSEEAKQSIQVLGQPVKNAVVAEIIDKGVGISEENMKKIFQPFFTTKGAMTGIGLGLSVVKDIIALHNGYIGIESKLGQGTKVTLVLREIA